MVLRHNFEADTHAEAGAQTAQAVPTAATTASVADMLTAQMRTLFAPPPQQQQQVHPDEDVRRRQAQQQQFSL